jgi:hypothetical protein
MFALAYVPHFLVDELAGLRGRGLAGPLRLPGTLDGLLLRHSVRHLVI